MEVGSDETGCKEVLAVVDGCVFHANVTADSKRT